MILFPESARVKENRKILLCKRSGGDSEISEIRNKNAAERAQAVGEGID
jgi:hypothetical protein